MAWILYYHEVLVKKRARVSNNLLGRLAPGMEGGKAGQGKACQPADRWAEVRLRTLAYCEPRARRLVLRICVRDGCERGHLG